jgi:hypothetical protein
MKPYDKETAEGRELLFLTETAGVGDTYSPARIVCSDRKCSDNANLVVLAETKPGAEYILTLNEDGTDCYGKQRLFMAPVKRQLWVNVYQDSIGEHYAACGFYSEEEAVAFGESGKNYVKSILIHEWEE